ncbi:MAG: type I secretion C-terminal target domain-containing protein [Alphaproteobacteria bacterium]|nr:type I secretion C-terminal target domain-containing protein [Alphaproteobacteria bacterium]
MSRFLLEIGATTLFSGGNAPTLQILIGGSVLSSVSMAVGATAYKFELDFSGSYPSSLNFRFDSASGDPGDSITFSEVKINGQPFDIGNYLNTVVLAKGQTAVVDVPSVQYLFGQVEPSDASLGTPTIYGTSGDDAFIGGTSGDDVIDAMDGNDLVIGFAGNDGVLGGAGNDQIFTLEGDDIVLGGTGDDLIIGGSGNDELYGQADNDILVGEDGDDILNGGSGDDGLFGDAGSDTLFGGTGNDTLGGGADDDVLHGEDGDDILIGNDGNDTLFGGNDNDQLFGDTGDDYIEGNDGDDIVDGGDGADELYGDNGNDQIFGGDGNDIIDGGADDDLISGDDGADTIDGGTGADTILGGAGADTIDGGTGNDILHGHSLDAETISAILYANPNVVYSQETGSFYQFVNANINYAAAITAATGSTLNGLAGHLVTITSDAENTFVSSLMNDDAWTAGADIAQDGTWQWNAGLESGVQFSNISGTAVNNMYEGWDAGQPQNNTEYNAILYTTGVWHDWADTSTHSYVIEWESGLMSDDGAADTISGGAGDDMIYGYDGDDILSGDADNDVIFGGAGSDTINGGTGNDVLFAYDGTVQIGAGGSAGATVTILSENFSSNAGVFSYSDGGFGGSDGANVDVTGTRITTDGNTANGALQVYIDGQNNNSFTNASGSWDASVSHTADLTNVQITFSYRHILDSANDSGEDSQVWFEFNGVTYDASGGNSFVHEHQGANGGGPDDDTGWVTVTIDLPDLTANTTYNLSLGILHTGANRSNEDAEVRFDDITITGDEPATGGPATTNTADIGETNVVNGGDGNDIIYGSSGTDTLNGDAGADTIYSASANEAWDALVQSILDNNSGIVYSAETNSFYQHVTTNTEWIAANAAANASTLTGLSANGHLATITSQAENDFIFSFAGGNRLWIGGTDVSSEGTWSWVNGEDAGLQFWSGGAGGSATNGHYSNWLSGAGEPSNGDSAWDYTEYRVDGAWWSNATTRAIHYIVEWDASELLSSVDVTTINGGTGADTLYGNDGIDIFDFDTTDAVDTIENFSATGRDAIDISDILSGYDYLTDNINDFVQLTESGGNTTISVDANGAAGGSSYTDIAVLNGVTGLDLYQMISADNLIV